MDSNIEKALTAAPVDADKLLYDLIAEVNLTTEARVRKAMPKPSTVTKLVSFFTSDTKPARTRRWAGMVLLYVMQEWNKAKEQVSKSTKAHVLLGEMVLGDFAELSILSASIIANIATKKDNLMSFWPGKKGKNDAWTSRFPLDTSSASWLNALGQFVKTSRSPSSSLTNSKATPVFEAETLQLDGESLQATDRVLRCIVGDRFVIMLAPPDPKAPLFIEIPYANMVTIMKTDRVVQDSATDSQVNVPVLVIPISGEPGSCTVNTKKKKVKTIHIFLRDKKSLDKAEKMLDKARDEHREPVSQIADTLNASQIVDDGKPGKEEESLGDKASKDDSFEHHQTGHNEDFLVADTMPELETRLVAPKSKPNKEVVGKPQLASKPSPAVGKLADLVTAISPEPEEPVKFVSTTSSDNPTPLSRTNVAHAQVGGNKREVEDIFAVPDSPAVKHHCMKSRNVPKKKTESALKVKGPKAPPKKVKQKVAEKVIQKVPSPRRKKISQPPEKNASVAHARKTETRNPADDVLHKDSPSSARHPSLVDEAVVRKVNLVSFSKGGPNNQGRRKIGAGSESEIAQALSSSAKRPQVDDSRQSPLKRRKTVSPINEDKERMPAKRDDQIKSFEDEEQVSRTDEKLQPSPVQHLEFMPVDHGRFFVPAEDHGSCMSVEKSKNFVPIEDYELDREVQNPSRRTSTRRTRVTDQGSPFLEGSSTEPESLNLSLQMPIHADSDASTPSAKGLWQGLVRAESGEKFRLEGMAQACNESDFSGILSSRSPAAVQPASGLVDDGGHDPFVTAKKDETYDGPGLIQRLAETIGIKVAPAVIQTQPEQAMEADESDDALTATSFGEPEADDITAEMEWEQSLEPRHRSILESLCRISRRFVSHVIGCEDAFADIVDDYFKDGTVLLNELDRQHVGKLQEYQRGYADRSASATRHKFSTVAPTLKTEHEKLRGQMRKHLGAFKDAEQIKHEGRQQLAAMMKVETV